MDRLTPSLNHLLDTWLDEDIGRGDLTAAAIVRQNVSANWIAKQEGVFCGGLLITAIFQKLDPATKVRLLVKDGENFQVGQKLLELQGDAASLLAGERTALNISMHLSGIASKTATLVSQLQGSNTRLADTRKTTPGLRMLEKYAFRCGGGLNHRLGLDDAAMLKENHLAWAGGINKAIKAIRAKAPWPSKVIVEVETPEQAEEAIRAGADGVLLDEIAPEVLQGLVPHLRKIATFENAKNGPKQIVLEASGVDALNLKAYAKTGIDLISSSAPMTRSTWIDFSMRFE